MALNVLVVDDSAVMRSMIIRTLRMSGVPVDEIHEAADGVEGLEQLSQNWIDLALVDINMPVMNGEEFIERVRAEPETRDLSVVVVSTEASETRITRLRKDGAGFVHKPFRPETLREEILQIMGMPDEWGQDIATVSGGRSDF